MALGFLDRSRSKASRRYRHSDARCNAASF